jgi:hypothetical protein
MIHVSMSIVMAALVPTLGGRAFAAECAPSSEAASAKHSMVVAKVFEDPAIAATLLEKFALPVLQQKVAELEKSVPSETYYGLQGESVGPNGLRFEVPNHDVVKDGKKVSEARYFWPNGGFSWSEKAGTFGPPGFQYYVSRHPLVLEFDRQTLEFKLSTTLEFKVAVAINFDSGFLYIKPWVFADSGFGQAWPNTVDVCMKTKVKIANDRNLTTETSMSVLPRKPIILRTLHGAYTRDCSGDVVQFLIAEMERIAAKFDDIAKAELH